MRTLSLLLGLTLALTLPGHTQEVRKISLEGKDGPAAPVTETGKDGLDRVLKVPQPQLLLYPAAKQPSAGTVLVCPGGAYAKLAVTHEGTEVAKMLNAAGWDAAVLLYRVNAGKDTRALALEDAKAALALVQKRGSELGLSTKKLGVMGFSAGGHLAARLTHDSSASGNPPDFSVLMYPAYLEKDGVCLEETAPVKVPAFVYVAANDPYAKSAIAFNKAAQEHNLRCEFHQAAGGGHGFGLKSSLPEPVRDWPQTLQAFLATISK